MIMALPRASRRAVAIAIKTPPKRGYIQCRWNSTSKSQNAASSTSPASSWSSSRVLLLSAVIGGAAFTGGVAFNKSSTSNVDYSRISKFPAPKYGSFKDMQTVSTSKIISRNIPDIESCDQAIEEIRSTLGEDSVSIDDEDLKLHGYSEWSPANIETLPIAVVYPKSTEEVSTLMKTCHKWKVPIIGYSGGSSLEGNYSAPHGGISVDFMHMDKVVALREEDLDVTVQPAVGWVDLNKKIASSGLFFPVDPSPSAKFGGMVGTNCSGTNAVRYGTMKDWVLNLTVVLADGTVIKTRNRPRKSAAGYNLNGIFVGSEGTLGLVTEITLKLAVIPKEFSVASAQFPTIRDAAATASAVMRAGVPVAAMEFLDEVQMGVLNKGGYTVPIVFEEKPTIFFKFSGTRASVADNIKEVEAISKAHHGAAFRFAKNEKEQELIWSARKQALWSLLAARPEGTELWTTDVAVPYSNLATMIGK